MFPNLKMYLITGAIIFALVSSFIVYYRYEEKVKANLIQENANLKISVELSQQAVKYLQEESNKIQEANKSLTSNLAESERLAFQRNKDLEDQDLINSSIKNPAEVEVKINDEYKKSIDSLVHSSGSN